MAWKFVLCCSTRAFVCSHALIPLFQTRWDWNVLFVYKHQSTALCFKHVWIVVPCFVYKHQSPALCFLHVWIVGPCLCTCISLQPFVSNTFDFGFLVVYPPAHTKMKVTPELQKILHRAQSSESVVNLLGERAIIWSG